jgi:hypothetical protein
MLDLNIHNDTSWNLDVQMMLFFKRILRGILIGISHCTQYDVHYFHTVASLCFKFALKFFCIKISYVKISWASFGLCCFSSWWWKISFVSLDGMYLLLVM